MCAVGTGHAQTYDVALNAGREDLESENQGTSSGSLTPLPPSLGQSSIIDEALHVGSAQVSRNHSEATGHPEYVPRPITRAISRGANSSVSFATSSSAISQLLRVYLI